MLDETKTHSFIIGNRIPKINVLLTLQPISMNWDISLETAVSRYDIKKYECYESKDVFDMTALEIEQWMKSATIDTSLGYTFRNQDIELSFSAEDDPIERPLLVRSPQTVSIDIYLNDALDIEFEQNPIVLDSYRFAVIKSHFKNDLWMYLKKHKKTAVIAENMYNFTKRIFTTPIHPNRYMSPGLLAMQLKKINGCLNAEPANSDEAQLVTQDELHKWCNKKIITCTIMSDHFLDRA